MANALLVKVLSIANSYMNPVALSAIGWVSIFLRSRYVSVQLIDARLSEPFLAVLSRLYWTYRCPADRMVCSRRRHEQPHTRRFVSLFPARKLDTRG